MNTAFEFKARLLVREFAWTLVALIVVASLALACFAQINPPSPGLVKVQRNKTHAELAWTCAGSPEAFQINRRIGGKTDLAIVKSADRLKTERVNTTGVITYFWTDKKLDEMTTYTYTVVAFSDEGTSQESNPIEIKP